MPTRLFTAQSLDVSIDQTPILKSCSLAIRKGELHVIMGPNGSGKSTLAHVVAGHPMYSVTGGSMVLEAKKIDKLPADERSRRGIFLAFQYPHAIPGVSVGNFIKEALKARGTYHPRTFRQKLYTELTLHGLEESFAARSVNDGFSGGEKKRLELVQMHLLSPVLAILDEIDSGLDVDGLHQIQASIQRLLLEKRSMIVITHYPALVTLLKPDYVHVMMDGAIVESGTIDVATRIAKQGYDTGARVRKPIQAGSRVAEATLTQRPNIGVPT